MPQVIAPARPRRAWLYLPDGWDEAWKAARAASSATPAWITVLGDSISAGLASTDVVNNAWPARLRAKLVAAGYPWYGDFWPTTHSQDWWSAKSLGAFAGTPPWVVSSANRTWSNWGYGQTPLYTGAAAGALQFTTPYACSALDLVYFDNYGDGSTWQVVLDGGAPQTVTLSGTSGRFKRLAISGLSNTTHTLSCGSQSADNRMQVMGVCTYADPTRGLGLGRVAYPTATLWELTNGQNAPGDKIITWQGFFAGGATGFGFPTQPSLAIIALGVNDCQNPDRGVAQYAHGLRRLVQAFRRGVDNASILLLAPSNPDGVSSDVTGGLFANSDNWHLYLAAMVQIARSYGCALLSLHGKWGELGVAKGVQTATNPHPTDAGHQDIADTLAAILV